MRDNFLLERTFKQDKLLVWAGRVDQSDLDSGLLCADLGHFVEIGLNGQIMRLSMVAHSFCFLHPFERDGHSVAAAETVTHWNAFTGDQIAIESDVEYSIATVVIGFERKAGLLGRKQHSGKLPRRLARSDHVGLWRLHWRL